MLSVKQNKLSVLCTYMQRYMKYIVVEIVHSGMDKHIRTYVLYTYMHNQNATSKVIFYNVLMYI